MITPMEEQMITLMEETYDNIHGGDIMITFMEEKCDNTQEGDYTLTLI